MHIDAVRLDGAMPDFRHGCCSPPRRLEFNSFQSKCDATWGRAELYATLSLAPGT
jgi:hypothetical protein